MFKAIMVSWIRKDCSQSPNRGPNSIASSSVRKLSSTSGVISVPFWIMPADCCITCWLTSKTASTILKVFVRIITATKVLNTHLKNIHLVVKVRDKLTRCVSGKLEVFSSGYISTYNLSIWLNYYFYNMPPKHIIVMIN